MDKSLLISNKDTLVLSGGGMKGFAHIGAIRAFNEFGFKFKKIIGTSIGSVIGLLYILKFTPEEIEEIMNINFTDLFELDIEKLFDLYGIDSGKKLLNYFIDNISKKYSIDFINNLTLIKLYEFSDIKFSIITTCLNNQSPVELNHISFPDLNIVHAIRMSIAIPFIFTTVKWKDKYYTDGGLLLNYPFKLVKNKKKAIGVDLNGSKIIDSNINIHSFGSFLYSIYKCIDKRLYHHPYKNNTIYIDMDSHSSIHFSMNKLQKKQLIDNGYDNTTNFIISHFYLISF